MEHYISRNHRLLENMVWQDSDENNREKRLLMVFPLDIAAHYLRCLELCKKLKDQFEISFAHSLKYDSFVRNCGFETFKVENSHFGNWQMAKHRSSVQDNHKDSGAIRGWRCVSI